MAKTTQVIVPTAINVLTFVGDTLVTARRNGDDMSLRLPSIRKRARMVVNNTGTLVVSASVPVSSDSFIR